VAAFERLLDKYPNFLGKVGYKKRQKKNLTEWVIL
jgi:hypothetical protein